MVHGAIAVLNEALFFGTNRVRLVLVGGLQLLRHQDKVGESFSAHLAHHRASMSLDRDLAEADRCGNLLVELACDDEIHDFALAHAQAVVARAELVACLFAAAMGAVTFQPPEYRIQQFLLVEWFGHELDGTALHGTDGHGNIAMPSDEDYGKMHALVGEAALEVQAALARQPHIEHQAGGAIGGRRAEEFCDRSIKADLKAYRPQ